MKKFWSSLDGRELIRVWEASMKTNSRFRIGKGTQQGKPNILFQASLLKPHLVREWVETTHFGLRFLEARNKKHGVKDVLFHTHFVDDFLSNIFDQWSWQRVVKKTTTTITIHAFVFCNEWHPQPTFKFFFFSGNFRSQNSPSWKTAVATLISINFTPKLATVA